MVYNPQKSTAMTLEEFGDKFIKDLEPMVSSNPYIAFLVLSTTLEFIARCKNMESNFQDDKKTKEKFIKAINSIKAFTPYRNLSDKLYKLRCGMVHTTMPSEDIILSSDENDLEKNVIGCKSLYNDIKEAWQEIKRDICIEKYLKTNRTIIISKELNVNVSST